MDKLNIAVIFGGSSPEYNVSLESAYSVISNLNPERYVPVPIGISREGNWYFFAGDYRKIKEDTWLNAEDSRPVLLTQNRGSRKLYIAETKRTDSVILDAILPVLHGKNGEDGTVQGLAVLSGIPLVGCGVLASALCMDKYRAHLMASLFGIAVPKSFSVSPQTPEEKIVLYGLELGYPLFVKPVKAGSSYGITKVQNGSALPEAIQKAFQYDDQVIIEENIDGFEVGCAVMGSKHLTVGEVDEIELSENFFDFTEKYTLKSSSIHVPARISRQKSEEIKRVAQVLYRALGCSGFARVDFFLSPSGRIVFNEVNTIPGFTEHSRFPGMMRAAGISLSEVLTSVIDEAVMACVQ